jgi:hypothetical protein
MHYFFLWSFSLEEKKWNFNLKKFKLRNIDFRSWRIEAAFNIPIFAFRHFCWNWNALKSRKREEQFQSVLFLIFHFEFFWRKKINRSFVIRRRKSKKEKKITHKGHKKFLLVCYANALIIFEAKSDLRILKRLWLNCTCFMLWIINKNQF